MKQRALLLLSGLLLLAGVAVSWAALPGHLTGVSWRLTALGSDELLLEGGGFTLFLIGVFGKARPGKMFSDPGLIVSVLCGLVAYRLFVGAIPLGGEGTASPAWALGCLRPLASLLGLLGSVLRGPAASALPVAPAEPVRHVYGQGVQPK